MPWSSSSSPRQERRSNVVVLLSPAGDHGCPSAIDADVARHHAFDCTNACASRSRHRTRNCCWARVGHAAMCVENCDKRAIARNAAPRLSAPSHIRSGNEKTARNVSKLKRATATLMSGAAPSRERRAKPRDPRQKNDRPSFRRSAFPAASRATRRWGYGSGCDGPRPRRRTADRVPRTRRRVCADTAYGTRIPWAGRPG